MRPMFGVGTPVTLVAFLLLVVAISGLQAGAEADNRAEIERTIGDPPELDWDEQEDPRLKYVPEKYTEPLEVDVFPESRMFEAQYKSFVEWLYHLAFDVAEQAALLGYAHPGIFGNPVVQVGLQGSVSLGVLGLMVLQVVRLRRIWGGAS